MAKSNRKFIYGFVVFFTIFTWLIVANTQDNRTGDTHQADSEMLHRKTIFMDLLDAEDRAISEAHEKYPLDVTDPQFRIENVELHGEYFDELVASYKAEVRARHGISEEQQKAISREGLAKEWDLE